MDLQNFKALRFRKRGSDEFGSTLIVSKENYQRLYDLGKKMSEYTLEEIELTQEMMDNAQVLLPPVQVPQPNTDFLKQLGYEK